jgi:hypothetical protein
MGERPPGNERLICKPLLEGKPERQCPQAASLPSFFQNCNDLEAQGCLRPDLSIW